MALPIEDYGIIGDLHTAALVGRDGSIDWLCLPRFDSSACFAALLGDEGNGHWRIAPSGAGLATNRRYRGEGLVLETEFATDEGTVRIIDCMPIRERHPEVVRLVEGVSGRVTMEMELIIRFGYGQVVPWVRRLDGLLVAISGPDALALYTPAPTEGRDMSTVSEFTVSEGQRVQFCLSWFPASEDPPRPVDAYYAVHDTELWWNDWSCQCTYQGENKDAVLRSLITLKALTYAPTGGIVAAATASLPETLGGIRNWDYRYCWLRDATLTLESLMRGGYYEEAMAWRNWLLRASAGDPSQLQIMYGPAGERRLDEWEVDWLPGYERSAPVRIGNAAAGQFQLDVYGEVLSALYESAQPNHGPDELAWQFQKALLKFLETGWRDPDDGIWEVRGPRRHFTHSKVMAWVAMDRAIRSIEEFRLDGPVDRWRAIRDEIHKEVCEKGFSPSKGAFTQYYGSDILDASLLMIPLVGFLPARDRRVKGTIEAIERELVQDGFVLRYNTEETGHVDGLVGREGAFLPCSFWLSDCLTMLGRVHDARDMLDRLLRLRNDLGLLSEEYDPAAGRLVGNFPQAFSHVSLVNSVSKVGGQEKPTPDHMTAALARRAMRRVGSSVRPHHPDTKARSLRARANGRPGRAGRADGRDGAEGADRLAPTPDRSRGRGPDRKAARAAGSRKAPNARADARSAGGTSTGGRVVPSGTKSSAKDGAKSTSKSSRKSSAKTGSETSGSGNAARGKGGAKTANSASPPSGKRATARANPGLARRAARSRGAPGNRS